MRSANTLSALALGLALGACSSGGGDDAPAQGAPPPGPAPDDPVAAPSALFVLGDSLSDVGNAAAAADALLSPSVFPPTVGLCNPVDVLVLSRPCDDLFYRQSRVSDGPVAVEHVAAHFDLPELVPSLHFLPSRPVSGTNYAVASAKAGGPSAEDLASQVTLLLIDQDFTLPEEALYVVMIGGNDAIDALQASVAGIPDPAIVSDAVAAIGANLERLLDAGARRVVVANVPDLAALPGVREEAQASGDEAAMLAEASAVSQAFNSELTALLDEIEGSGQWLSLALGRFDLHAALDEARSSITSNGGNVLDACFDSDAYRDSGTAARSFHPDCAPEAGGAPRFADFAFWDDIHPTGAAHTMIGAALVDAVIL